MYLSLLRVNVGNQPAREWLGNLYRVHQRLWMAFPDEHRKKEDPFFLGEWNEPAIEGGKRKRSESGFLFRIERDGDPRILVQSAQRPDWKYAFQNAPYLLADDPRMRQFDPAPRVDELYRFRLLANVVRNRRYNDPNGRTRKTRAGLTIPRRRRAEILVHPHRLPERLPSDATERQQVLHARWEPWRNWLAEITTSRGFRICCDDPAIPLQMETVHTHVRRPAAGDANRKMDWRYNGGLFDGVLVCTDSNAMRDALISGIGPAKAFGFGLLSIAPAR